MTLSVILTPLYCHVSARFNKL